jgi:hypothetical protein
VSIAHLPRTYSRGTALGRQGSGERGIQINHKTKKNLTQRRQGAKRERKGWAALVLFVLLTIEFFAAWEIFWTAQVIKQFGLCALPLRLGAFA